MFLLLGTYVTISDQAHHQEKRSYIGENMTESYCVLTHVTIF